MIFHDEQIYTQLLSAVSRQGLLQKSRKELILIDTDKQAFTFTLWEETIIEDEGKKLLDQFQKRLIIFARRIGVSKYNGISLTTKFNTTIQIDPPYSQCLQLHTWVTENREMLTSFSLRSTSESGSLISISVDEQIVPIANVQSQQDGHSFSIETKVSLPNKLKSCYVLLCPNCKQEVRSLIKRKFLCMTCKQQNMLIPRCKFDVNLQDASGSIIGIIMDKEAEKLLSLTTDEIYALASNENIQSKLNQNFYIIQVKKSFSRSSQATSEKLYIKSCTEKGKMVHSLPESPKTNIEEGNKRKKKHLVSFDEETEVPTELRHSLKLKQKLEPTTPVKNK
ncbi:replication protein A 70 kDa DNA-binding subunit B-like isoform X2 [Lycium barbarum]|uniref:replication protein A 70 kDa DNA-binding subunit B-like isoform X2 n=1 Tax=Lycium barbarum TaxID=112863 RepID=UPI00293E714C|nr:replication protein A 70 kDa DNA-binding subunit B-like isoform X2 [Lycium barbarum]XP_060183814.1 replication protein A 70 kDa DNA-binding subunit B-like isoform X2 [Lycium barbarum]